MKLDSVSHKNLYRMGTSVRAVSPFLWDAGLVAMTLPKRAGLGLKFAIGERRSAGRIMRVNLEVTTRCNLRCGMCWWWGKNAECLTDRARTDPRNELGTKEIFAVIDRLANYKPSIYLSGGEPFIRKDMADIIEYISGKGMPVILTSNGTLMDERTLKRLSEIENLAINFSVDGPREVHDAIRGDGVFDKVTRSMKRLIELRQGAYPVVNSNTTFSPGLLGHTDELARYLADEIRVDSVRLQHTWFASAATARLREETFEKIFGVRDDGAMSHVMPKFQNGYVSKLADEIALVERTSYGRPVFVNPRMSREQIARYYQEPSFSKADRCVVAWNTLVIRANGDVMLCPDGWTREFSLGNVRSSSIGAMWNGEAAGRFREAICAKKKLPACAKCCALNDGVMGLQ
ncbi:Coenzyme PQQ synthesis protein E [uncultured archaeon]|nr:Coenzyme PQQ synthesis protein E [uncultured archaeon]